MSFRKVITLCCVLIAALLPPAQASAQQAPDVLVREVTNEVLEIVRADEALRAGEKHRVMELVDAKVLPHFDFRLAGCDRHRHRDGAAKARRGSRSDAGALGCR